MKRNRITQRTSGKPGTPDKPASRSARWFPGWPLGAAWQITRRGVSTAIAAAWIISVIPMASAQSASAAAGVAQGVFNYEGKAFKVVDTAAFATAGTAAQTGTVRPVGLLDALHGSDCDAACDVGGCDSPGLFGGGLLGGMRSKHCRCGGTGSCGSCGVYNAGNCVCGGAELGGVCTCGAATSCGTCGGGCNGACGNYGPRRTCCGMEYGHYNGPLCDPCYDPCNTYRNPCGGTPCLPFCYLRAEGLFMDRGGDGDADYDFEPGLRVSIGKVPDCAKGCEITYTGLATFDSNQVVVLPRTATTFEVLAGEFESEFHSLEINRTLVLQDIARLLYGIRYIQFDEEFDGTFTTLAGIPTISNAEVENSLIGGQIGGDFFYPLARRVYADIRGRAGAYVNFGEFNGTAALEDEEEDLAGFFELGVGARYLASRRLSIFARGELWYLSGVATIESEALDVTRRGFLNEVDLDESIVFYGFSGGFELKF